MGNNINRELYEQCINIYNMDTSEEEKMKLVDSLLIYSDNDLPKSAVKTLRDLCTLETFESIVNKPHIRQCPPRYVPEVLKIWIEWRENYERENVEQQEYHEWWNHSTESLP